METICPIVANRQGDYMIFSFLPLHRADLYNLRFEVQTLAGTLTSANFSAERFVINSLENGFWIYSIDSDIKSWFQSGKIYEFKCVATLK